jgi:hypothetical protein
VCGRRTKIGGVGPLIGCNKKEVEMLDIPISSPLSYVGVFLAILGFFLILAGLKIITIEKITVTPGRKTWVGGIVIVVIGLLFLLPEIKAQVNSTAVSPSQTASNETQENTPLTVALASDLYDDFDDQKHDGSLDQIRWEPFGEEFGQIYQENGNLVISHEVSTENDKIGLNARAYRQYVFNAPTFFETALLLENPQQSNSTQQANISMGLFSDSALAEYTLCILEQSNEQLQFICSFNVGGRDDETVFNTGYGLAEYNEWYTFRIEVYPTTMAFSYFINDQIVGTYKPQNVEELRSANYVFSLGINGFHSGTLTGRIDNVKIGEIGQ